MVVGMTEDLTNKVQALEQFVEALVEALQDNGVLLKEDLQAALERLRLQHDDRR